MLKLSSSKVFKNDLEKYTKGIEKIKKTSILNEYLRILQEFKKQCQLIDNAHSTEYNGYVKPQNIRDNVVEMVRLRRKLEKFLNDA